MSQMMRRVALCAGIPCVVWTATFAAVDVGPRVQVSSESQNAQEISAVASPTAPYTVVAAWQEKQFDDGIAPVSRIMASVSIDGDLWSQYPYLIRPPCPDFQYVCGSPDLSEGDPFTAFDPQSGRFWAGGLQVKFTLCGQEPQRHALVFLSTLQEDNTFSSDPDDSLLAYNACPTADKGLMVAGRDESSPDSTRLYLPFNRGLVLSDDEGATWLPSPPAPIEQGAQGYVPRIAPDGSLFIAYWVDKYYKVVRKDTGANTFTTLKTFARRACCDGCQDTCDCTSTCWGADQANSLFPGGFRVVPYPGFAINPINGTLYVVYMDWTGTDADGSDVDIYFSKSTNGGTSWSAPIIINGGGPGNRDQFMPWIEVDRLGRLHAVYFDTRNVAQSDGASHAYLDTYYAYSEDDGRTWHETRLTNEGSWDSAYALNSGGQQFIGDYLGLAVGDNVAWAFYPVATSSEMNIFSRKITFSCAAEGDCDMDGRCNPTDNCATLYNPDQNDLDGDGVGDACEGSVVPGTLTPTADHSTGPGSIWSGSYLDTFCDDGLYEDLIETYQYGKAKLTHVWKFANVPAGAQSLIVTGHRTATTSNESFQFYRNPTGSGFFVKIQGATISLTGDVTLTVPMNWTTTAPGDIYIQVKDTNTTDTQVDHLFIDRLAIRTDPPE